MDKVRIGLLIWALLATVALAWVLGKQSAQPEIRQNVSLPTMEPSRSIPKQQATALIPAPDAKPKYPQYVTTVPKAFWGNWDEIVADKCEGREARFFFDAQSFMNFEVQWDVSKIKLYSPTEMDMSTTTYDEDKNQINETWEFRLVDSGRTLTGRKKGSSLFKRCPTN
jgi:hypothetical protein